MGAKEKFADLKTDIIKYAGLVEEMVEKAMTAFLNGDKNLASSLIEYDERQSDSWENKLDEACISFIALYQPEAKVLRFTMMIYKMASDLERIGDIATNIAKDAAPFSEYAISFDTTHYETMKNLTLTMLRKAINAFVQENASLAEEVIKTDTEVNALRDTLHETIISRMNEKQENVLPWLILLSVSRHLEKIADITTNIAEEVIYISEGRVVKHHHQKF